MFEHFHRNGIVRGKVTRSDKRANPMLHPRKGWLHLLHPRPPRSLTSFSSTTTIAVNLTDRFPFHDTIKHTLLNHPVPFNFQNKTPTLRTERMDVPSSSGYYLFSNNVTVHDHYYYHGKRFPFIGTLGVPIGIERKTLFISRVAWKSAYSVENGGVSPWLNKAYRRFFSFCPNARRCRHLNVLRICSLVRG